MFNIIHNYITYNIELFLDKLMGDLIGGGSIIGIMNICDNI